MTRRTTAALALAFLLVVASTARADLAGHVRPQFFGGSAPMRDACLRLARTRPSPLSAGTSPLDPSVAEVTACLDLIRGALGSQTDATLAAIQRDVPRASLHAARHRQLLSTYRALQQLEPWVRRMGDRPEAASATAEWIGLEADAIAALNAHGLLGGKYAATLHGDLVRADPGGYTGRPPEAPNLGSATAAVSLDIETEHMPLGRRWDFSLVFNAGQQPLLVMVKTAAASTILPAYVQGLTTSTGFRLARASTSTETAFVAHIGAARLGSESLTVGSGSQSEPAVIAANDAPESALFFDGSIDFRWYARDVWLVHLAAEPLDPLVHIYVGAKHDQRFHRSGDLEPFDDPTGRVYFGFDVTPIRVTNRRAEGSGRTVFTLGGGFEFEGAIRTTNRLPSGFKLALTGNLNLLAALQRLRRNADRDPNR